MAEETVPRGEVAASLRAGRELGPDYDDAIADSLAERLEHTIDERVRVQLARHRPQPARHQGIGTNTARMILGIIALGLSVPLSAIGGALVGPAGLVAAWLGLITFYILTVRGFGH
ncbi:hypothetical protein [Allosalinactinospora lopnorensis]|uniref:hypothetical protein n=1 Tax=Allosalinactinospora lopnorensis TaxID=1352348 RepID=UPI000623EA17|nr:hypothetical protein [Allosalinactinospora lopnorensis]